MIFLMKTEFLANFFNFWADSVHEIQEIWPIWGQPMDFKGFGVFSVPVSGIAKITPAGFFSEMSKSIDLNPFLSRNYDDALLRNIFCFAKKYFPRLSGLVDLRVNLFFHNLRRQPTKQFK